MFDWEDLRHFCAFTSAGSLSAAAKTLGVDHATVARRIASLEASFKLKLVDRRPRAYALTDEGRRVAELRVHGAGARPEGSRQRRADHEHRNLAGSA
ncbi:LysR family transcriptional regulator [Pseudomonas putida]|nr:LysR family transcriptional regulator [Pseudomonas putida]MDG9818338.1 LysR family transcriptional regulator [Pseudomonas putida]